MEPFWLTLQQFRDDTLPVQLAIIVAYVFILYRIAKHEGKRTDVMVKVLLALTFLFNGIVCFLLYCGELLVAKFFAGPLYMTVGFLFLVDIAAGKIHFTFKTTLPRRLATIFFIACAFLFPVFGYFSGHGMIALPGIPCPLAIFTLALLGAALPRTDGTILGLLLAWAMVNIPKVFGHVSCYEEIALILAGMYVLGLYKMQPHTCCAAKANSLNG